ncbi:ATP-binding protein [Photobacterium sp. Alg240-V54]|uniref:ATP-binding protein n=1 Tax=Photobacterium sp. Alg240-V54 TaxID=2305995 RepID=UPI0013D301E0|nr:ATP-binding protein [Photobacterium sp. Alg240-V54]
MKKIFEKQIDVAKTLSDPSAQLNFQSSILRSLMQLATITSLEYVKESIPVEDPNLDENIERFLTPSDGMPITLLDQLIPIIRSNEKKYCNGWFEATNGFDNSLCKDLLLWVQFRNKIQAHGVLDQEKTRLWANKTIQLIERCLKIFDLAIPKVKDKKLLTIKIAGKERIIESPLLINGNATVISRITQKKTGWKMSVQPLNYGCSDEVILDLSESNIFATKSNAYESYKIIEITTNNNDYIIQHNSPVRQTDTFEGRTEELEALTDWLSDDDSRRCLVYGDGGYGKTTLVLEFINQLLESNLELTKKPPEVICYYSAKMTRWTSEGITYFTSIQPVLDDSVRELMGCLHDVLSKDWYTRSGRALVNKAVEELKANKFTRDEILIILDNTETLASTSQETKELAQQIDLMGRVIGRVIVTSRRQESIEAKQLLVQGLTMTDSVNLLQSLAHEHKAKPIIQAGDAKLRKISEKLMYKPILLEALVIYISRANVGIEQAMENLYRKSNDELLEFLYEDAWERIGGLQKEAFFILASLHCPLDQYSISRTCQLLEIQHSEFQTSLSETHFATVIDYGSHYILELVELAKRFFIKKLNEKSSKTQARINSFVDEIDKYVVQRNEIESAYKKDRIAEAFRSELAKAAKVEVDKNNINEAIVLFELALEEDSLNAALHDRYAWILFNKTNEYEKARTLSEKAVSLNPDNCDAIVNYAIINYRLNKLELGDKYIELSEKLGRPKSFVLLRKAIARQHKARLETNPKVSLEWYGKSMELLNLAEKFHENISGYDAKNLRDIKKYQDDVRKKVYRLEKKLKAQLAFSK